MEPNDSNRWVDERLAKLGSGSDWQPDTTHALVHFKARRDVSRRSGARMWVPVAAALTIAVLIMIVVRSRTAVPAVNVSAAGMTLKAGQVPPDFTLQSANGGAVKLSAFQGKVVLLNFWATWCGGCKVEIPWFMEFASKYKERGLAVIGVALDDEGWKKVKPYVDAKKIDYPIVVAGDDLSKQYGVEAMPMTYLIDRQGKIAATHIGMVDKDNSEKEIVQLLSK